MTPVSAQVRSDHSVADRAEIIVAWLGITEGDPAILADQRAALATILQAYIDADREASAKRRST